MQTIEMREIPIKSIHIDQELQVRKTYSKEALGELESSLGAVGALQPLLVERLADGSYRLILGSRRVKAAEKGGMKKIPAVIVSDVSDKEAIILMLNENMHREELSPFEEGLAILELIEKHNVTPKEIADFIGRHEQFVRRRIKLMSASPKVQQLAAERKLSMAHLDMLAGLSLKDQDAVAEEIDTNTLREDEAAVLIRKEIINRPERMKMNTSFTPKRFALRIASLEKFFRCYIPQIVTFKSGKEEIKKELAGLKKTIKEIEDILDGKR
ncbi:MAG: ParB/RepB/Spo0J family partition protein [bacterium]|nr:ParB/RepB/Spo0J family partition protein [bacterium]